jgi:hypothetical protein
VRIKIWQILEKLVVTVLNKLLSWQLTENLRATVYQRLTLIKSMVFWVVMLCSLEKT